MSFSAEAHGSPVTNPQHLVETREEVAGYFLSFRHTVYRYLRHCGYARTDAEDVTQEAFLLLYRACLAGERIREPLAFTITLAKRRAVDRLRRQRCEQVLFEDLSRNLVDTLPDQGQDCEGDLHQRQRGAALTRALQDMSPLQRECLHWRSEGLSLRDTSAIVGVSEKQVSQAVQRGIRRVRKIIGAFS